MLKEITKDSRYVAFADDFLLLTAASSRSRAKLDRTVNNSLENFVEACRSNGLKVSADETEAAIFGKARR